MPVKNLNERVMLNNGVTIPQVGLGVWRAADGEETRNSVRWALETGYRLIDTASYYQNETSVGQGIRDSGLQREDIFVTTKLWNDEQGYENALQAFSRSKKRLGLEYLDLYLLHFPVTGKYLDTWKALEKLVKEGYVRAIGVCNFHAHHLEALLEQAEILPVVNQIEFHPYLNQENMRVYNNLHNIRTEAWAPIAKGRVLQEEIITSLAKKYEKTPAQIVLRWELQKELVIIPKSVHKERIEENSLLFDFSLTDEECSSIDSLHCNGRIGTDPDDMVYE